MVVRKKADRMIDESDALIRVRQAIMKLNEGELEMAATKKAPAKKPAKAPAKKKVEATTDLVSLTDIAEKAGVSVATARRILRNSDLERPSGRWAWAPKDVDKVVKVLQR